MKRLKTNLQLLNNWKWLLSGLLLTTVLVFSGCGEDEEKEKICTPAVQLCNKSFKACSDDHKNYYYRHNGKKYNCDGSDCSDAAAQLAQEMCGGGGDTSKGQVSFWTNRNCSGGISVTVSGGGSRSITRWSSGGPSGCGQSGNANFSLRPGTYRYTARGGCGVTWTSKTFTIRKGACLRYLLSHNGGGSSTGKVIFWTNKNCSGGLTVTVSGRGSKRVTHYRRSAPSCGTSGFANWTLPAGRYTYTATGGCGVKWNRTSFTITKGRCLSYHLRF